MARERSAETLVKVLFALIILEAVVVMAIGLGSVISGLVSTDRTPVNQTRFQLVGHYGISETGHQVIVFRDTRTGQCYMMPASGDDLTPVRYETCER